MTTDNLLILLQKLELYSSVDYEITFIGNIESLLHKTNRNVKEVVTPENFCEIFGVKKEARHGNLYAYDVGVDEDIWIVEFEK